MSFVAHMKYIFVISLCHCVDMIGNDFWMQIDADGLVAIYIIRLYDNLLCVL